MLRNRQSKRTMETRKQTLWRGLCLLASVLAAAPALLVSVATDAYARHHYGAHAVHVAPRSSTIPVSKRDAANSAWQPQDRGVPRTDDVPPNTLSGTAAGKGGKPRSGGSKETWPGVPAKDAKGPNSQMKGLGAIDTSITVQPRLHGAGPGTVRQAKSKIGPLGAKYSHARSVSARGNARQITRNAIGLSITPRNVVPVRNPALVRLPASAPGFAPSNSGVVKPNPEPDRLAVSHPAPLEAGQGAWCPALNGNGFVRRGFVPATLGGPTKNVVVGIDGSTIRPKH